MFYFFCSRGHVESNLTFLGLLVLQNALKMETAPVIQTLHDAAIRTVMVTGTTPTLRTYSSVVLIHLGSNIYHIHQCLV